ncbi:PP2C family serine/threonine-protein phosphatase [Herpetosiphon llansteffanensis]|uniref:PP2C family serine/threonine-protein phosphatase n=1 Tax=Herpetosiphon llansteffanensis TaxID=2094568 RepID=UPI000D7C48E4|nr:PP2C family serine/threonine-protein phosphatase [Herpetosiphon llansteffanensis]
MKQYQRPLILVLSALLLLSSMLIVLLFIRLNTTNQQAIPITRSTTITPTLTNSGLITTTKSLLPATIESILSTNPTVAPKPDNAKPQPNALKPTTTQAPNSFGAILIKSLLGLSVLAVGGYFLWARLSGSPQLAHQRRSMPKPLLRQNPAITLPPVSNSTTPRPQPATVPSAPSNLKPAVDQSMRHVNHQFHVFSESIIGKSHIQHGLLCQDYSQHVSLGEGWGVAVMADGLGSRKLSHLGSEFVVEAACEQLLELVKQQTWHETNQLPNLQQWQNYVIYIFQDIYAKLQKKAQAEKQSVHEFACTLISVIYSPIGILVAHIGDGRAGYSDRHGQWHSMITPHKGEEANEVMPFTADQVWKNPSELIECQVINEQINGFVLISDGCEKHTFQCSQFDQATQRWHDPNQPHQQFFDRLQQLFREKKQKGQDLHSLQSMFKDILERGNTGFANEPDDKTMILGLWI